MKRIRLLVDTEGKPASYCMAFDEAMLILRNEDRIPDTLRLYVFKPHAVTIGYFQRIREVVDLDEASRLGVDVVRRFTGGGAVYHDTNGELTYSIALRIEGELRDVAKSYEIVCRGIVEAIRSLGLDAQFVPINDVVVRGRKVSGSAQARRSSALLQHGTLMYATNLDTLARVLKPPKEKLRDKGVEDVRHRVTTLSLELGRRLSLDEVVEAVVRGFSRALNAELVRDEPTEAELRLAEELEAKYRSFEWNYRR